MKQQQKKKFKPIKWVETIPEHKVNKRIESIRFIVKNEEEDPRTFMIENDEHLLSQYGDQWVYVWMRAETFPDDQFSDSLGGIPFWLYGQRWTESKEHLEELKTEMANNIKLQIKEKLGLTDQQLENIPIEDQ